MAEKDDCLEVTPLTDDAGNALAEITNEKTVILDANVISETIQILNQELAVSVRNIVFRHK